MLRALSQVPGHRVAAWIAIGLLGIVAGGARAGDGGETGEPPAGAVIGDVPFERSGEPNRIVVDLSPEGVGALPLILDTGATHSVVTPMFAEAFGVRVPADRTSFRWETRLGRALSFQIDRSNTEARSGLEYGLLGGDFLAQFVLEIDFAAQRVRFIDPIRFAVPEATAAVGEAVVPLHIEDHRPVAELEMNGTTARVLIDTGAHDPLLLSMRAARKLGVEARLLDGFGVLATPTGPMPIDLYETDRFAFAGFAFGRMPVTVAATGWNNLRTTTDSAVGYDTLQQFTVRLDYARKRMWLHREHTQITFMGLAYPTLREVGVFLIRRPTYYEVTGVLERTPAADVGLRPGDVLQDVGNGASLEDVLERITQRRPLLISRRTPLGTRILLTLPAPTAPSGRAVP